MLHSTVSFIFLISVLLNLLLLLAFLLLCSVPTPSSCSSLCLIATLFWLHLCIHRINKYKLSFQNTLLSLNYICWW